MPTATCLVESVKLQLNLLMMCDCRCSGCTLGAVEGRANDSGDTIQVSRPAMHVHMLLRGFFLSGQAFYVHMGINRR